MALAWLDGNTAEDVVPHKGAHTTKINPDLKPGAINRPYLYHTFFKCHSLKSNLMEL